MSAALCLSILLSLTQMAALSLGSPETGAALTEAAARSLEAKLQALQDPKPGKPYPPVVITETEANSYLKFRGHDFVPAGIQGPEIHISAEGVSGAADVDFDQLNQLAPKHDDWTSKAMGLILRGKQHVRAAGNVETSDGLARVTIASVTIGNVDLPAWFVEPLVQDYVRTHYRVDLAKPIALPSHVTHIELGSGQATLHREPAKKP
jgi:hypothetical protein